MSTKRNIFFELRILLVSFMIFFWKLSRCFLNSMILTISVPWFSKAWISLQNCGHIFYFRLKLSMVWILLTLLRKKCAFHRILFIKISIISVSSLYTEWVCISKFFREYATLMSCMWSSLYCKSAQSFWVLNIITVYGCHNLIWLVCGRPNMV